MFQPRLYRRLLAAAIMVLALAPLSGARAEYPEKPIRLVVPFPPGGVTDLVARLMAERLSAEFGQQVLVDNRTGAGGVIAGEIVAKAPADGYTLLLTTPNHTINAAFRASMPYDTDKDLRAVSNVGQVQAKLDNYTQSVQFIADRKLNLLAVTSARRLKQFPDVPTVSEQLPGFESYLWMGIVAPAATPDAIVQKLATAARRFVALPETQARFDKEGVEPVGNGPDEFAAQITREIAVWRELAKATKITVD